MVLHSARHATFLPSSLLLHRFLSHQPQASEYRPLLTTLFSRYVDPCLEYCRRNFKTVVPLPAVNQVG